MMSDDDCKSNLLDNSDDCIREARDNEENDANDILKINLKAWEKVSVELVLFLYMMAYMLTSVVEESLFVDKACRINLKLPANVCDHISTRENGDYKKQVQVVVSNFRQYESIALHAVPMVLALLLGAWSDRHGRKLPMLLGLAGSIYYAIMLIVNIKMDWPLEMVLYTATFPSGLTGSSLGIFLAGFTYIADITTAKDRTQRVTFLEVAYLIPMPTGVALGSYIFTHLVDRSYLSMFIIHLALQVLAFLYACLTMRKKTNTSAITINNRAGGSNCMLDIWNWSIIVDTFKTVFKKRQEHRRFFFILVVIAMGLYTFQRDERHMVFLYTQLKFHWSVEQYSQFRTFYSALLVMGLLVAIPVLTRVLSLKDTHVASLGCLAHTTGRIIFATAQQPSVFYIGAAITAFGPMVAPVLRSITSKLVPPSERGKAFSMLTVADTSVPVISGTIYTQVYNATINTAPSSFFWVTVISQLLVLCLVLTIHFRLGGKNIEQAEDSDVDVASVDRTNSAS